MQEKGLQPYANNKDPDQSASAQFDHGLLCLSRQTSVLQHPFLDTQSGEVIQSILTVKGTLL